MSADPSVSASPNAAGRGDAAVSEIVVHSFPSWNPRSFPDSDKIMLAYRHSKGGPKEHWLNKLAMNMTRLPTDRSPGGEMCHVELLIQTSPGHWCKTSINFLEFSHTDEAGADVYRRGVVHFERISEYEMSKYVFTSFRIPRENQKRMYEFARAQHGAPFNFSGYVLNNFPLGVKVGVVRFEKDMLTYQKSWFCSEYVTVMLQAGNYKVMAGEEARLQSPNSLYRLTSQRYSGGIGDAQPVDVHNLRL